MTRSENRLARPQARRAASTAACIAASSFLFASAAFGAPDVPPAARFKAALMPLVAGHYAGTCMDVGPSGAGAGYPVVLDRAGRISAGPRSDDVVDGFAELTLTIGHAEHMMSFAAQALGPDAPDKDDGYTLGVDAKTQETLAGASGGNVDRADLCHGGPTPPGHDAALWPIAATFVKIADKDALCQDTRGARHGDLGAPVVFSGTTFAIGTDTLSAAAPHKTETILATDQNAGGFSYAVDDGAGNVWQVVVDAHGAFTGASLHRADDTWLTCGPRPPK